MKTYKLGQKFLSIKRKVLEQIRFLPFGRYRLFGSIYNSLIQFYKHLKEDKRQGILFLNAMLLPPLLTVIFSVVLPLLNWPNTFPGRQLSQPHNGRIKEKSVRLSPDQISLFERIKTLEIEQAFLISRFAMAKSDSISLSVDLVDSVINLEISGTVVRQCKIYKFKTSRAFARLPHQMLINWLSSPFGLQEKWATTPKVPIVVKKAPKDTLEALKMNMTPVIPKTDDVYFTLKFDRNLSIKIEQEESPALHGRLEMILYKRRISFANVGWILNNFFHLKSPSHDLLVTLKIAMDDARAIYRALPDNTVLALRLN